MPDQTKNGLSRKLHHFLVNPRFTLCMGLMLIICGVLEGMETVFESFIGLEIKGYHGIILFGLSQVVLSVIHIVDGLTEFTVSEVEKEVEEIIEQSNFPDEI